jgi:hypothetical protein
MGTPRTVSIASAVFFLCMLSSCSAPTEHDVAETQADPRIDCEAPGEDIQVLADEKSRMVDGSADAATTVAPDAEVIRIMGMGEDALRQMTASEYSASIDQRMKAIRKFCLPNVQCPHWVIRSMC